jgi:hypothetical protein
MEAPMFERTASAMWVALAIAGLACAAGTADAGVRVKQKLRATTFAPKARGNAKLSLESDTKGVFSVVARRLESGAQYDLVVGGIKVGSITTNGHGAGKAAFGTTKRGTRGLLGFDPRGRSLAVRDRHGNDVLDCDMPDDDAGKVACCVADDDGIACKHRTPENCTADGGTVSSASGCFPDPCTPDTATVVCCTVDSTCGAFVDDDPAVGCRDDVTAERCANEGGTVVGATSCEPNPCAPVPPVALVTCCVPDDEVECQFRTPDRCAAKGGTVSTAATCDPNPCAAAMSSDHQGDDGDQGDDDHDGDGHECRHHHQGDDDGHGDDD